MFPWESSYFTIATFAVVRSIGLPLEYDGFNPALLRINSTINVHTVFPHRTIPHQSTLEPQVNYIIAMKEGYVTQPTPTGHDCFHTPMKRGCTHDQVVRNKAKALGVYMYIKLKDVTAYTTTIKLYNAAVTKGYQLKYFGWPTCTCTCTYHCIFHLY